MDNLKAKKVSIIVPIYKGNHYIPNLFFMLEKNWEMANKVEPVSIELVLVNDFPKEKLRVIGRNQQKISLRILANPENKGIHFSRVHGFLHSCGDYILFLDQDDEISPVYVREQLKAIGDNDAIICNAKDRGHLLYENEAALKAVSDLNEYKKGKNQVISPGQVLLKRKSVPAEWLENIMWHNGADDYLLWMLMLQKGCKLKVQNRALYWHVMEDGNLSNDFFGMSDSVSEMTEILVNLSYLTDEERVTINRRHVVPASDELVPLKMYRRELEYNRVLELWMAIRDRGISVKTFLLKKQIKNIAIYGGGILGKHLYYELLGSGIQMKCFLDQNKEAGIYGEKTIVPGEPTGTVDAIIVTPFTEYRSIRERLELYYSCSILSIETVLLNADCELEAE